MVNAHQRSWKLLNQWFRKLLSLMYDVSEVLATNYMILLKPADLFTFIFTRKSLLENEVQINKILRKSRG